MRFFDLHRACAWLAAAILAIGLAAACNRIDVSMGRHASLSRMVTDVGYADGELECWLTLEFTHYPEDGDLQDVRVRFESIALAEPAEFDWAFIASRDKLVSPEPEPPSWARREAEVTAVDRPPPLGQPTSVRFPLHAKPVIDNAPATLYLEAELFWGGVRQHATRSKIEHVYSSLGPHVNPTRPN